MNVKDLIENLKKYPDDMEVDVYTPCGPSDIKNVFKHPCGYLILDCGEACEHIMDGKCVECENTNGKIWKKNH